MVMINFIYQLKKRAEEVKIVDSYKKPNKCANALAKIDIDSC